MRISTRIPVVGSRNHRPWATALAAMVIGLLAASCCCQPCCPPIVVDGPGQDPDDPGDEPQFPGYTHKKVRFKNKGSKPVAAGMVTEYTPKRAGNGGFTAHANDWTTIPINDEDTRSKPETGNKRAYRLTFTITGGPTVTNMVVANPGVINGTHDVGWCFVELHDAVSEGGDAGFKLKFQFEYMTNGEPGVKYTPEWWSDFIPDP